MASVALNDLSDVTNSAPATGDIVRKGAGDWVNIQPVLAHVTDVTMTVANLNSLDDAVDSTLHFHATDRARANHTGTQAKSTIDVAGTWANAEIAALPLLGTSPSPARQTEIVT